MTDNGGSRTRALVSLMALLFVFSVLAAVSPAVAADPDERVAPVLAEGDGQGLVATLKILGPIDENGDSITDMLEGIVASFFDEEDDDDDDGNGDGNGGSPIGPFDLNVVQYGLEFDLAVSQEVLEVDDDYYTIAYKFGTKVKLSAAFEIDIDDDPNPDAPSVIISMNMTAGLIVDLKVVMEKESLALKSMALEIRPGVEIHLNARNFPDFMEGEFAYRTISIDGRANIFLDAEATFEPALNIFNLPHSAGDTWQTAGTMDLSSSARGEVDASASGNHSQVPELKNQINAGLAEALPMLEGSDSSFNETGIPLPTLNFEALSDLPEGFLPLPITLPGHLIWVSEEVVDPEESGLEFPLIYDPDLFDLSLLNDSLEELADQLSVMVEDYPQLSDPMTVETTSVEDANEMISFISTSVSGIGLGSGSGDSSDIFDITGFFLDSPYYGILALAGLLLITAVITRR